MRGELAGAEEGAGQVHGDDGVPLGQAHALDGAGGLVGLDQQAVAEDAGVVDQAVQPAERRGRVLDQAHDVVFAAHVGDEAHDLAGEARGLGDGGVHGLLAEITEGHVRAQPRQAEHEAPTHAAAAARDTHFCALNVHVSLLDCSAGFPPEGRAGNTAGPGTRDPISEER